MAVSPAGLVILAGQEGGSILCRNDLLIAQWLTALQHTLYTFQRFLFAAEL